MFISFLDNRKHVRAICVREVPLLYFGLDGFDCCEVGPSCQLGNDSIRCQRTGAPFTKAIVLFPALGAPEVERGSTSFELIPPALGWSDRHFYGFLVDVNHLSVDGRLDARRDPI